MSVSDKAILVGVYHGGAACVDRAIGSSYSAQSMCLNSRVRVNQDYDVLSIKQCSECDSSVVGVNCVLGGVGVVVTGQDRQRWIH